ncbi:MAG: hypothetical protein CM15mP74_32520 [Halieaceae bacterium]|nr:MAG: hypothetical protein CM15mP74_32520 [Halieaceae bacterium]
MSSITQEKLMAAVLVAAALVGIALAGSGYWALWQSRSVTEDQLMPASLVAFPERKPLAEFILVDDEKGVFDLKSSSLDGHSSSLVSCTALTSVRPPLYDLSQVKRRLLRKGLANPIFSLCSSPWTRPAIRRRKFNGTFNILILLSSALPAQLPAH